MIVTPRVEQDAFLNVGRHTTSRSRETPAPECAGQITFEPKHVSVWCMSKRKRFFDVVFSVAALVLFAPLMMLIGWLIKLTSRGPALFRQERVGLHQEPFIILKFRTMRHCKKPGESGSHVTRHGDPRRTQIGALLRRLKLDELPQLINVARGDMSFVGPRPKIAHHEKLPMLCRPGITGAATIVFSHEESLLAEVPEEFVEHYVTTVLNPEKCRLDSNYIETASFVTDLRILVHTIFKISNQPKMTWAPPSTQLLKERYSKEETAFPVSQTSKVRTPAQKKFDDSAEVERAALNY